MELATSGSLTQIVRRFGGLTENVVQVYTKQILKGLQYLHSRNAVHRDIKGENVLVDGNGVAKLGDFGCSKFLADVANKSRAGCASLVGSPFWMAPEVIRNEAYGTKADIWSLGCTVVEMLNGGHPPWSETFDNVYSAMYFISNSTSIPTNVPDNITDLCKDFLSKCFDRDVVKRASATELLNHPWLSEENLGSPLTPDQLHTAIQHGAHLSTSQVHSTATSTMGTPSTTNNNNMHRNRRGGNKNNNNGGRPQLGRQDDQVEEEGEEEYGEDEDEENGNHGENNHNDGSVPQNVVVGGVNGGHSPRHHNHHHGRDNNNNNNNNNNAPRQPAGGWSGLFEGLNSSGPAPSSHMTGDSNSFQPSELSGNGSQYGGNGSTF
jgi:serine/threonine protein kinase